jgi:hypothetical protein
MLISKGASYNLENFSALHLFKQRPSIDIKPIAVIANGGRFRGSGLDKITDKGNNGRVLKGYYEKEAYEKIEEYIREETASFLTLYRTIYAELPKLNITRKLGWCCIRGEV